MRKKQKKKNKNFFNGIIYLILIGLLIYSGIKIFKWNKENSNNNNITDKINEAVTVEKNSEGKEDFNINFNTLKKQNEDTVAWIKVNNTNVKYPVVKAKDNSFYLTHSFDKSNNSAGWIFADYKNKFDDTDKNIVIYGHNRRDGSMFSS